MTLRTDFSALEDGAVVVLHPRPTNRVHRTPVKATYLNGFFFCEGTDPATEGPDYYLGDVARLNLGFEPADGGT